MAESIPTRVSALERKQAEHDNQILELNKTTFVGNGMISLKEACRNWIKWNEENERLPETVRNLEDEIRRINAIGWAILLVLLGILVNDLAARFFPIHP